MRRLRQDHDSRMESALDRQDAFAVLAEQKSYNRERQRAEEDYQRDASAAECRLCPEDGGRSGALRSGAGAAPGAVPAAAGGPAGAVRRAPAPGEGGVPEAAAGLEPAVHRRAHRAAPGDDRPADRPDRRAEPGALPAAAVHECHAGGPAASDGRSQESGRVRGAGAALGRVHLAGAVSDVGRRAQRVRVERRHHAGGGEIGARQPGPARRTGHDGGGRKWGRGRRGLQRPAPVRQPDPCGRPAGDPGTIRSRRWPRRSNGQGGDDKWRKTGFGSA